VFSIADFPLAIDPNERGKPVGVGTFGRGQTVDVADRQSAFENLHEVLSVIGAEVTIAPADALPLPPVPRRHLRRWHVERTEERTSKIDYLTLNWNAPLAPGGRWFTAALDQATTYLKPRRTTTTGRLFYVDVPRSVAERARLYNQPEAIQRQAHPGARLDDVYLDEKTAATALPAPNAVYGSGLLEGKPLVDGLVEVGTNILAVHVPGEPVPWQLLLQHASSFALKDGASPPSDWPVGDVKGRDYLCATLVIPVSAQYRVAVQAGSEPTDQPLLDNVRQRVAGHPGVGSFRNACAALERANVPFVVLDDWAAALCGRSFPILAPPKARFGIPEDSLPRLESTSGMNNDMMARNLGIQIQPLKSAQWQHAQLTATSVGLPPYGEVLVDTTDGHLTSDPGIGLSL